MTKDLFEYINILLPRHRCVTIPGFGAFILNKEEGQPFDVHSNIVPPSYSITFNSRLQHDDGTLSSYVQSIKETSYEKASKNLSIATKALRAELLVTKAIACGSLGKIELTDGNIIFTQNKNYSSPSHYGLAPIGLTSISSISQTIKKETKSVSLNRRLIIAAASTAAVMLFALLSTNITDSNTAHNQQAGYLKSLVETNEVLAKEATDVAPIIEEMTPVATSSTIAEASKPTPIVKQETPKKSARTYYLIIGGESTIALAQKSLDKFKEQGLTTVQILESPQRYRIYMQAFDDMLEADRAVVAFRHDYPEYKGAWIHSQRN